MADLNREEDICTSRQLAVLIKAAAQQVYQLRRLALHANDIPLDQLEKLHTEISYLEVDIIKLSDEMTVRFAKETTDVSRNKRSTRKIA